MASRGEATEDADGVTEETKEEKDKEEDAIGKSVNIGDKKSLKEKPLSFSMQKLSSKSLFSNLFSCKNVGSVIEYVSICLFPLISPLLQLTKVNFVLRSNQ